jgi:NhaP-type Na+/H+ or K+/H+ antiporter
MRSDAGRGLLAQGQVAVALAVAFRLGQQGSLVDIGYNAVLISVLFHDFVAPWALRGLLLDAGELRSTAEAKL